MQPDCLGVPSYAVAHLAAAITFTLLTNALLTTSAVRHVVALTLIYLFANFIADKIFFDYVVAGERHTVFDHPSLAHFSEPGFWGWQLVFFPLVVAYPILFRIANPVDFLRAVALTLPPVIALQKLACFLAGCCGGCPTSLPWAVVFPDTSLAAMPGVPVHPLQAYDALLALAVGGGVLLLDRKGGDAIKPFLFPCFVGLYALARFATEFLRADRNGNLAASQWIEAAACVGVVLLFLFGRGAWRRLLKAG